MRSRSYGIICISLLVAGFTPTLQAQTIEITRNGATTALTKAEISRLPHVSLTVSDHGDATQFEGVPLSVLLENVGLDMGLGLRGPELSGSLLIESADGECVVFSLAEIDPTFSGNNVILADRRDGKELDLREGWFRVIAPNDKRTDRWLRQVSKATIVPVK
jgi:hypothetical protein